VAVRGISAFDLKQYLASGVAISVSLLGQMDSEGGWHRTANPMKHRFTSLWLKLLVVGLVLWLVPFGGCGKQSGSGSGGSSSSSSDEGDGDVADKPLEVRIDHHGDEIMASSNKYEAREWLKDPKHVFFKADRKEIAKYIEDFYTAGATQVMIAETEEHDGTTY